MLSNLNVWKQTIEKFWFPPDLLQPPLLLLSLLNLKMSQNLILSARKFLRPLLFHCE